MAGHPATVPDLGRVVVGKRLLVLDYDGTVGRLDVDWKAVRRELTDRTRHLGFVSEFQPFWDEIARFRDECGVDRLPVVFEVLQRHESTGVLHQTPRKEIAEQLGDLTHRTDLVCAIFSVNLHQTIAQGLDMLGLSAIRAIVGSDDVDRWKPDPTGLYRLLHLADVSAHQAVFVGDSPRDAAAAEAAGVEFVQV